MLVASSDAEFRRKLREKPEGRAMQLEEASSGAQALAQLGTSHCDILLLDRHLPDIHANEVADLVRRRYPEIVVQFVDSRAADSPSATPADLGPLGTTEEAELKLELTESVAQPLSAQSIETKPLEVQTALNDPLPGMIGRAPAMQEVYRLSRLVGSRDTTVLISGETGTGKELVARGIHQISTRAKNPFVVVNCAAIPEALLEAELFGHARGAFTGAVQSRLGRIHGAHGGTLFLDEVGELPLSMQAKLLRFLQNGEVQRLGSSDVFRVDVRVICATNVRLLDSVKQKQFRQDLYYRLAVFPIELPPLRKRIEDLAPLSEQFLIKLCEEGGVPSKRLAASALAFLRGFQWPGNIRELQHAVERAFILSGDQYQLHVEHFSHLTEHSPFRDA
jgi:DNA-binding NtrC family response regulator